MYSCYSKNSIPPCHRKTYFVYYVGPTTYISVAEMYSAGANNVYKSTQVTAGFLRGDALVLLACLEKILVIPLQGDFVQAILTAERSWSQDCSN